MSVRSRDGWARILVTLTTIGLWWVAVTAQAEDEVAREWRHVEGDSYEWQQESVLELSADVETRMRSWKETTRRTQSLRGIVEVLSVNGDGTASIRFRVTRFRLSQTGPYALELASHHDPATPDDRQSTLISDEVPMYERQKVEQALQAFADRLIFARFDFRVSATGEVSDGRVKGRPFDAKSRDPAVRRVLLHSLGVTSNEQLVRALGRSLAPRLPGGAHAAGSTWSSTETTAAGFHSFSSSSDARLTVAEPDPTVASVRSTDEAGNALVGAYCEAMSTKDRQSWDVADSTTTSGQLRGELLFSIASGRPVAEHMSGVVWSGTAALAERGGVLTRELRASVSLEQSTAWGAPRDDAADLAETPDVGDAPETESEPEAEPPPVEPAPPTTTPDPDTPRDPPEWDDPLDEQGRPILSWHPEIGRRLRITRSLDASSILELEVDGRSAPIGRRSRMTTLEAEATVTGDSRNGRGRRLSVRLRKYRRLMSEPDYGTNVSIERQEDGRVTASVEIVGELDGALSGGDPRRVERELEADLVTVVGPLFTGNTRLTLEPTGDISDVEATGEGITLPADRMVRLIRAALPLSEAVSDSLASALMADLFAKLPGEAKAVGARWSVVDQPAEAGLTFFPAETKRSSRVASHRGSVSIADKLQPVLTGDEAAALMRQIVEEYALESAAIRRTKHSSRHRPISGRAEFDPARGIVAKRSAYGTLLDIETAYRVTTRDQRQRWRLHLTVRYNEALQCEVVEPE